VNKSLFAFLCFVTISTSASTAADPTGTVSLVCTNVVTDIHKTLGLTLVIASARWMSAEVASESPTYFPKITSGSYFPLAPNDMILRDSNGNRVGELSPIVPGTAKKGDANINLTIDISGSNMTCKVF
jgi:hypothetical protein